MTEAIITHYTVGERNVSYVMNVLYQGKQWTIQRRYSDFTHLDKKLKKEGYTVGYDLPNKVVFGNYYPSVLDHRRKELNKYLSNLSASLSSDNTYLREFFEVDENILKIALKKSRRMSDIYRSDNIMMIYKRACELMIHGNVLRQRRQQRSPTRREYYKPQPKQSSSFSSRPKSAGSIFSNSSSSPGNSFSGIPISPPRMITTTSASSNSSAGACVAGTRKPPKPPLPNQPKSSSNNAISYSVLQESTRQRDSFSSNNDSLIDSLQESAIMAALKDDFMTQTYSVYKDTNPSVDSIFHDASDGQVYDIYDTNRKDYISNVNSCFRQKSDDGTWNDSSSNSKVIDILSSPPPSTHATNLATMDSIANLIKEKMSIPFDPQDVLADPRSKWENECKVADWTTRPTKPPYHRPHSQESTVPLRLRFTAADAKAGLPPHMIKHLL